MTNKLRRKINSRLEQKFGLSPIETGAVTDRLFVVNTDSVDFYVYQYDGGAVCLDAGYRPRIARREFRHLGLDPDSVTHVFLSHADIDHVHGIRLFKNADIYLSAAEEQMITGIRSLRHAIRSPRIHRGYQLLREGDVVTFGQAFVRAIETPGHTPGSMAYLLNDAYLYLGDTCKLKEGQAYAGKHYTLDYETQKKSIRKLAQLPDVRYVLTAHSGYTDDFQRAFEYWK